MASSTNWSPDLIWEIARSNNAHLVKRRSGGGVQFSRDPLNLLNKNSRKHAGFLNEKAFGINYGDNNAIRVSKKGKTQAQPAGLLDNVNHSPHKSSPSVYRSIVGSTAKQNYRPDLRREAVARASALRQSRKPVKARPVEKGGRRGKASSA